MKMHVIKVKSDVVDSQPVVESSWMRTTPVSTLPYLDFSAFSEEQLDDSRFHQIKSRQLPFKPLCGYVQWAVPLDMAVAFRCRRQGRYMYDLNSMMGFQDKPSFFGTKSPS